MLRSLMVACVLVVVPLKGHAETETEEMDFLDMVNGEGNVLIRPKALMPLTPKPGAKAWPFLPWGTGLSRVTALRNLLQATSTAC